MGGLFFLHREDAHGAGLGADTAGNALAGLAHFGGQDHHMHGAGFHALAAAYALLFVNHVHALGVLTDGFLGADPGAFAAHDAAHDLGFAVGLGGDADAAEIGIKLLIKGFRAGPDAGQAGLAGVFFADH